MKRTRQHPGDRPGNQCGCGEPLQLSHLGGCPPRQRSTGLRPHYQKPRPEEYRRPFVGRGSCRAGSQRAVLLRESGTDVSYCDDSRRLLARRTLETGSSVPPCSDLRSLSEPGTRLVPLPIASPSSRKTPSLRERENASQRRRRRDRYPIPREGIYPAVKARPSGARQETIGQDGHYPPRLRYAARAGSVAGRGFPRLCPIFGTWTKRTT